uniref:hypothetical protein n=1 Tax=Candidatus Electrothrix sp. TaxID=2170559 RepID=UPI0040564368
MRPFVPENFICDTSLHLHDIVEQTTSWLTVNPMFGCSLGCVYCFRAKWEAPDKPALKTPVETCLRHLEKHQLFIPNHTPLSANVSSTDALLPQVKKTTFDIIKYLDQKGYKNIFGIISKLKLSSRDILFLSSLENIRPVILVSYAGIPNDIEPVPVAPRIENLKQLNDAGLPSILYFRPIVEGWNDKSDNIANVLAIGNRYASAISIGGLRLSKEIRKNLESANVTLPQKKDIYSPKIIPEKIESKILDIYYRIGLTIPLFKHTSCAVSYIFNAYNYNQLYKSYKLNCMSTCPSEQKRRCFKNKKTE